MFSRMPRCPIKASLALFSFNDRGIRDSGAAAELTRSLFRSETYGAIVYGSKLYGYVVYG